MTRTTRTRDAPGPPTFALVLLDARGEPQVRLAVSQEAAAAGQPVPNPSGASPTGGEER
jgi:hypothetical protein